MRDKGYPHYGVIVPNPSRHNCIRLLLICREKTHAPVTNSASYKINTAIDFYGDIIFRYQVVYNK